MVLFPIGRRHHRAIRYVPPSLPGTGRPFDWTPLSFAAPASQEANLWL